MERTTTSLFDVFLRLRPPISAAHNNTDRYLEVDPAIESADHATHITIHPPSNDHRKRAIEKFAFTKVFTEESTQADLYHGACVSSLLAGVIGEHGRGGRDGLLATLGVTGSGKSHTILGSKTERGLAQMTLDVLFKGLGRAVVQPGMVLGQLASTDATEATMMTATAFLESIYGEGESRAVSRAQTPMPEANFQVYTSASSKRRAPSVSMLPQTPSIEVAGFEADKNCYYSVVVSMYEVYNDRIFDLLSLSSAASKIPGKDLRKRALLFKNTERSTDHKVVAGLKKVVCGSLEEALLVLETGLMERRVADTKSNSVSSRSHGFFCVEVKRKHKTAAANWTGSSLSIVDLAGSERARTAKTAGATLVEAGKINESLMYLGQCMQMQSDNAISSGPEHLRHNNHLVPYRSCKLTELLFSNSFSHHASSTTSSISQQQKAIMIVTADPRGDFNATSQILRYSALAREVTVPRIPSVTSTILSGTTAGGTVRTAPHSRTPSGSSQQAGSVLTYSNAGDDAEYAASAETEALIAQLAAELEVAQLRLEEEMSRRQQAESAWTRAEEKAAELEVLVREECWDEFEKNLALERNRWRVAWEEERERMESHVDGKLEIAMQGLGVRDNEREGGGLNEHGIKAEHVTPGQLQVFDEEAGSIARGEEGMDLKFRLEELERENAVLQEKLKTATAAVTENNGAMRTPSRKLKVLKARKWDIDADNAENIDPDAWI